MQYFTPRGANRFAGDCMPFYHAGTFHLFWLLDTGHHRSLGGWGGHVWAHASSRDLKTWQHHPVALALGPQGSYDQSSICTGSVIEHKGTFYAFYTARANNPKWRGQRERVCLATSRDLISFEKWPGNPILTLPKGYADRFDSPFVVQRGRASFDLIIASNRKQHPLHQRNGVLLRYRSRDLMDWRFEGEFLQPGGLGTPECPDCFEWNGWHYLIFSHGLVTHYRMSRRPHGPWLCPPVDTFEGSMARVMKTAGFRDGRRIGAAFIGTRYGNKDNGRPRWGGNIVLRELVQNEDGTLGVKFPAEAIPPSTPARTPKPKTLTPKAEVRSGGVVLPNAHSLEAAVLRPVPRNVRIRLRVRPRPDARRFGLKLRADAAARTGYDLEFDGGARAVRLHNESIAAVEGLDKPFSLDVVLKDDIIDVCIGDRRCLINRCPELHGEHVFLYSYCGRVAFERIALGPLAP